MIPRLYIPTWSGDYRLDRHPDDPQKCLLSISKPTESEKAQIKAFLAKAQEKSWVGETTPRLTKKTVIDWEVNAPLDEAGAVLLEVVHGTDTDLWTGIKVTGGKVDLVDTKPGMVQTALQTAGATAAAVIRAPAVGCPAPEPCNVRASEVLAEFSTQKQMDQWNREGFMAVQGSQTGQRYWLFHRNEAARRGLDHSLVDEEGYTCCTYHPTYPAEEEALAIKLMVEHREQLLLVDFARMSLRKEVGARS